MLRDMRGGSRPVSHLVENRIRAGARRSRPLSNRRRYSRFKGTRVLCDRGVVMDISAGGLRLRTSSRYSGRISVEIWTTRHRFTLAADVVWSRRLGFRRYELGLEFQDVDDATAEQLHAMASSS